MLVFALSQLPLSSLHSGLPQFHVSLNVLELELQLLPIYQLTPHFHLFIVPSLGYPPQSEPTPPGAVLLPCCPSVAYLSDVPPVSILLYPVSFALALGNSFGWKEFGHWCEFFLDKNGMKGWKFFFPFQNKENKTKTTTHLKNTYLWVVCNVHGFLVQQVTQTRNLASSLSPMFFAHSWTHS